MMALQALARRGPLPLLMVLVGLTLAVYLGMSAAGGFVGYPLDDAWIHQTYARNLARQGEFAFVAGQPSAGSTSPLWSALLAIGHWLGVDPRGWAYALGALSLGLTGWLTFRLVRQVWPDQPGAAWAAAAAVAVEWHLGWASVSGMETGLFAAIALAVLALPVRPAWGLGALAGLSVFIRPDGLLLLPFVLARLVWPERQGWRAVAACVTGFGAVFALYLAFNVWIGGTPWPNTFYAKQEEYAALRTMGWLARALWRCDEAGVCGPGVAVLPLIGAQALTAPGLVVVVVRAVRERRWAWLIPLGWAGALVAAYVVRLPVSYQYGRYVMAAIPVLVAVGLVGLGQVLRLRAAALLPRVLSRVWALAYGALAVVFWLQGAVVYGRDVRFIETEMVAAARWVAANTAPGAVIAAHDIGALGYFAQRPLLDLAGLVSPEVIPFIRDEDRLAEWLTASRAEYLMTFPSWYPRLVSQVEDQVLFRTAGEGGYDNLVVYRWPPGQR